MEEVIKIRGGKRLNGTVTISGSKNSTVALIPAAALGSEKVTIYGVPQISDVEALVELLEELGVQVTRPDAETLIIDPSTMEDRPLVSPAVQKLRASYYFMGALLGKYGRAQIKNPGGCHLGPRPIDLHLKGFQALGASVDYADDCTVLVAPPEGLKGARIFLDISSVGATINIMMAAVFAQGKTVIENAAREPEIIDIATMLNKMGAKIHGMGTNTLVIDGCQELKGCFHEIIPDRIEAATYILIAAAMADDMWITNVIPQHLEAIIAKLEDIGINLDTTNDAVHVFNNLPNKILKATDITTKPYPGFATDVQQPFSALLTRSKGRSTITESIYAQRFKHLPELARMGANTDVSGATGIIVGPTPLHGARVTATDLRCGAALVIAGLMADGETEIHEIKHIDRGYDRLDKKLKALGADIRREIVD